MTLKIDSHVHFWQIARGDYSWMTEEMHALQRDFQKQDFNILRSTNSVSDIVLVQAAPTYAETRYILDLADDCDFVGGVIGKIDIEDGEIALQQLAELSSHSLFRGIRPMIKNMGKNRWLELPLLDMVVNELIDRDLSFECMVLPGELQQLAAWLGRFPDLAAVLSHAGMPDIRNNGFASWSKWMKHVACETNVFCKLSGLTTLAGPGWDIDTLRPYVEHLLSCFGYERLIWGSDWPVMLCAGDFHSWCSISDSLLQHLDEKSRQAVFFDNAKRFYRLASNQQ